MYAKTPNLLPHSLAAGILGFCLRLTLYRIGFDEKNILSATHPLQLACLALTALMAVYLWLNVRTLGEKSDSVAKFPASPLRALGFLAAACFTAFHALTLVREISVPLNLLRIALAFAGSISMGLCALPYRRFRGLRALCRGIVCAFFAIDMLCRYQSWSGNPQLPDYVFQVLACAALSLLSYQRLAFDTGLGKRRRLLFLCPMGLYLCLLCAAGPETRIFYLGGACWAASCLCSTQPAAKAKEEPGDDPA